MGLYTRFFESPGIFYDSNPSGEANMHSLIFIPFMLVQIPRDCMKTYAKQVIIANVSDRVDELDVFYRKKRKLQEQATTATTKNNASKTEPYLHLKSGPKANPFGWKESANLIEDSSVPPQLAAKNNPCTNCIEYSS
jgi:hypothetical protein